MTETARLFAALKVSPELARQIGALPRKGLDSARWSHAEDLHITLRYIGDAPSERVDEIADILDGVRVKSFRVVVRGLEVFEKKHQGILYADVESARMVTHLSAEVTEKLQSLGFVFPDQHYRPHVTVARVNKIGDAKKYAAQHKNKIRAEWDADSFILYRSANPDQSGRRYSVVREYFLSER